jgi:hypothetical protein
MNETLERCSRQVWKSYCPIGAIASLLFPLSGKYGEGKENENFIL